MSSEDKKRSPNVSMKEKCLLLNIVQTFKDVVENKKTDTETWKTKDNAWEKISHIFNSQTTGVPRSKVALRKYYDNLKRATKKEVATELREIRKTGGGKTVIKNDPTKDLVLSLMNKKTVFGLQNSFDGDSQNVEDNIPEEILKSESINQEISEEHSYVQEGSSLDNNEPSTSQQVDWSNVAAKQLKRPISGALRHSWTKRRRPVLQSPTKLTEEYSELAKVKLEVWKFERENQLIQRKQNEILFNLQKQKLEEEIRLTRLEIEKLEEEGHSH